MFSFCNLIAHMFDGWWRLLFLRFRSSQVKLEFLTSDEPGFVLVMHIPLTATIMATVWAIGAVLARLGLELDS